MLQAGGYQAILHGHAGAYRSHIPTGGCLNRLAWHRQARGLPAPCHLAAGAHPGLLCDGGLLAASRPATHHQRLQRNGRSRGGATPPHWSGAATRGNIYVPRGKVTPSGPRMSWTSTRGPSRTPALSHSHGGATRTAEP